MNRLLTSIIGFFLCLNIVNSTKLINPKITMNKLDCNEQKKIPKIIADQFRSLNAFDMCICGAFATIVGDFVMHPVDTIKVMQQASTSTITLFEAAKKILSQNGPTGFYQGVVPYLAADGLSGSIKFAAYEMSKRFLEPRIPEKYHTLSNFVCAAGAYLACSVALVPGEVLKTRMQAGAAISLLQIIKNTWVEGGLGGFFVGYGATLLRDVPYTMLELGLYENIKSTIKKFQNRNTLTPVEELTAAAITGGFTGFVTTPLDVIKTKIMVQGASNFGIFDVCSNILTSEGTAGLFAGSLARVAWLLPFTTIYLGVYELAKRQILTLKESQKAN